MSTATTNKVFLGIPMGRTHWAVVRKNGQPTVVAMYEDEAAAMRELEVTRACFPEYVYDLHAVALELATED
jgi:hypothetical protein